MTMNTPESSIHVTPSITGRSGRLYVPAASGARTLNVNVPVCPGSTVLSTVVDYRILFVVMAAVVLASAGYLLTRREEPTAAPATMEA